MLAIVATALSLTQSPCPQYGPVDRFFACELFQSDTEATNFAAHVGWALALPLAGHAVDGKRGALIGGGVWLGYSLANEFLLHGPESGRERALNLVSRMVPTAVVLLVEVLRK
jgi:hypothetical protein